MPRGRHRRPTHRKPSETARRAAVGATVLGTTTAPAIAMTAPAAHASGYDAWVRLAGCEASGNWHTDTGNGYFGGLQFAESTWLGYGGGQYARYANDATEWQQITIGERVLRGQGVGAWPVCGPRAGLTPQDAYDGAPGGAITTAVQRPAVSHAATQRPKLGLPGPSRGRHAVTDARYVTVQRGDNLSRLAEQHRVAGGWEALWRANAHTVRNPNLIFPGQKLVLPR